MTHPRALVLPVLALLACVPARNAEQAPVSSPSMVGSPIREVKPTPEPTEPTPTPEPEPPARVIADSDIRTGTWVEAGVQPGLATFAAELDTLIGKGPGSVWVGKLDGNGGRDVLIYVPPQAVNAEPFELVFHFHGTYSESVVKPLPDMPKKEW